MIEIKITDPANTPAEQLRLVSDLLLTFAGDKPRNVMQTVEIRVDAAAVKGALDGAIADIKGQTIRTTDPAPSIDPDDNPAAGTDAAEVFAGGANPAEVFAGGANPAEVFAQGNATGAVNAPSTAGAETSSTAPAAPTGISTNPTESLPNAQQNAPAAATAATSVPPGLGNAPGVDLDKNGLPWDARIHSESKNKNKDGSWRNKRGVAPEVVTTVEAELRAVLGNATPAGAASQVAPAPTSQVAEQPAASVAPNPGAVPPPPPSSPAVIDFNAELAKEQAAATVPPPPAGSTTPPPSNTAAAITFPQLCAKITNAINGGTLTQERLGQVLNAHKLTGLPTLAAFPHLVPTVATELGFA